MHDQDAPLPRPSALGDELFHRRLGLLARQPVQVDVSAIRIVAAPEPPEDPPVQAVHRTLDELVGIGDVEVGLSRDELGELGEDFGILVVNRDALSVPRRKLRADDPPRVFHGLDVPDGLQEQVLVAPRSIRHRLRRRSGRRGPGDEGAAEGFLEVVPVGRKRVIEGPARPAHGSRVPVRQRIGRDFGRSLGLTE